uniref:protein-tyrosine-phosphatase n=1 Tax=Auxenochlorella protothecoides TaxID=3075 RepID=A0A1D2A9A3_AUXPR
MPRLLPLEDLKATTMAAVTPVQITPGVWVGGAGSIKDIDALGISHVVTALNGAQDDLGLVPSRCLWLDLEDSPTANLLVLLPDATAFIQGAVQGGGSVLVRCAQGVSRSAAIAVAHLMASAGLDDAAALEAVRHAHPAAQPNPGFLEQLALFGLMGCRLDPGNAGFREFRAYQAALAFAETGALDCAGLADVDSGASSSTKEALHRCRRCRAALARGGNCLEVEAGPGPAAFAWRKRDRLGAGGGATAEPSLWVEPLAWMEPALRDGATQGKLYCPRCGSRLGTYNWAGMQSASGRWVVPAFQLHRSRIDTEAPLARERAAPIARAVPRLLARRQPVVGGARQEGNEAADAGGGAGVNTGDGGDAGPGAATDAIPGPAQASAGASGDGESTGAADTAAALEGGLGTGVRPTPAGGATAAIGPPASLPSFPAFTHLILDCDGVMVDSERPSCESLRLAVKQVTGIDVPHSFPEDYFPVFGMDLRTCLEYYHATYPAIGNQGVSVDDWYPALSVAKEDLFNSLTAGGIAAFPGIKELIAAARGAGLGVAIASSGSPGKIARNLQSSGLAGLVPEELTVSAAYVARGKPAPDVYLEALRRLGCADASRALVIEDAVNGCRAARAAGCFVVGVTNTLPRAMMAPAADLVVDHVSELEGVLVPAKRA